MFTSEQFKFSRSSLLAVLLTLSIALVACGPDRDETTSDTESGTGNDAAETNESSEEPPKPDALHIWANDDEHQLDAIEYIAEAFTEETGIDVNITPFDMFDQTEAIALDGPAGTGPDLFYQPHDRTGDIALQGLAQPVQLDDETMNRFTEEAITGLTFEGELYGVPFVSETYALLYNTELVPEVPETMDELLDIAEELTDPGADQYGFLAEANNFYFVYPFFSGYGGYVFDVTEEGFNSDDIGLANEGAVQGGQLIQSWFENNYIPTTIDADIMNGLFVDGNVGVALTGPWSIPQYRDGIGAENLASAPLAELES
jgi:arabinogalactan oligomer / maltooligosaccharide transport system substrate-binding protein